MWVVPSGLFRGVGVRGRGDPMGRRHVGGWVCLGYLGVWYGGVGCRVEAMFVWG